MNFEITVSKGTVTYDIEAENAEAALDQADELYNERRFETQIVKKTRSGQLYDEIAQIELSLSNDEARKYTTQELMAREQRLYLLRNITNLWESFGNTPVNNGVIAEKWHFFEAGTCIDSIKAWFESYFNLKINEHLEKE